MADSPDTDLVAVDDALARTSASQGYGITDAGFVPKPFARLLSEKLALARAVFGPDLDLTSGSAIRKILEIAALEDARTWSELGAMYDNQYVSTARGEALSRLGEELGLPRPFLQARGTVRLVPALPAGTDTLVLPLGSRMYTAGNHDVATTQTVTLSRTSGPREVAVEAFYPGPEQNLDPAQPNQRIASWNPDDTANLAALITAAGGASLESIVAIEHTVALTGGELQWPDARYRDLLLRAPRSIWTPEAIRIAASLVPGVRRVVVRDGGGLDINLPVFGTFNFAERVFGAERDLVSPQFFTVLVAPTEAAIWDGPAGLAATIQTVVDDLRPIGIYPRIEQANRVYVGIQADLVVSGVPLPRTASGVLNDSEAARNFKAALIERVARYVDSLDFGEPVRFAEVMFALMGQPGLADVRNLALLRSPPRFTEDVTSNGRTYTRLQNDANLTLGVNDIATLVDDVALLRIV
jgi:hypothetical protein